MEEFFKELMNTANPKYIERSIAHKSPKDLEDVCIRNLVIYINAIKEILEKYS